LTALEILDLHGNAITALPQNINEMFNLRILNLGENKLENLPFNELEKLPLTELVLKKNNLKGTLIAAGTIGFKQLQTLDIACNQLTHLVPTGSTIQFPVLHTLTLSMNRIQELPDMVSWPSLLALTADENNIAAIPESFFSLEKLRQADFSSNDIRVVPPELARMDNLAMIRLSGNPLRDKKFVSMPTEELKEALAARLEPPPPYHEAETAQPTLLDVLTDAKDNVIGPLASQGVPDSTIVKEDVDSDWEEDFATPPTSAPHSPNRSRSQTVSSMRSRAHTQSNEVWPVKQGGLLDRSHTESSTLQPAICVRIAAQNQIRQVHIHHNIFAIIPLSLNSFAATLNSLSLANNQLMGDAYLDEHLGLPALKELNLSSNRITGFDSLIKHLEAPMLEKLDVSLNRISALPPLKGSFPSLSVLLASTNQLTELEPASIQGLKIVDVSSNDIARLDPRIGLLGGPGGLERLEVAGNRFKIPRWDILERGTAATLQWLRGRVPVAELAEWRNVNGEDEFDDIN
jgi:Leucine-rich repeat (LRR) protein